MQVVSSILKLQSGSIEDPRLLSIFDECQNRIQSMADIHEMLYQTEDLAAVEFQEYIKSQITMFIRSYAAGMPNKIVLKPHAESTTLGIDTAIPVGLMINELVSNVLKLVCSGDCCGTTNVGLYVLPDRLYSLDVKDNGIGMKHVDLKNPQSMCLRLLKILCNHIIAR